MSVASPHFTDLESPFERKTFRVERAISDPVEPRFELCLLLFRDIFEYTHWLYHNTNSSFISQFP